MAGLPERHLKAINDNPINNALDDFRAAFKSTYPDVDIHGPLVNLEPVVNDSVGRGLALRLIGTFLLLPAASALPSENGVSTLSGEMGLLYASLSSKQTNIKHTVQLVKDVVACAEDITIWTTVIGLIAQTSPIPHPTTPPERTASSVAPFQQTPWSFNTGNFANTSELREHVDPVLKSELGGNLIINHPEFFDQFLDVVPQLGMIAAAVFEMCKEAETPLYTEGVGWAEWPEDCKESKVLHWLRQHIGHFLRFANELGFQPPMRRRCFATPNKPIPGSVGIRKLDVGIVYTGTKEESVSGGAPENANDDQLCNWCDVLVPGELKSNPQEDNHSSTWFDLSRYAREIFAAEATRRSIIGFTLCGSIMRLWELDRLGGVASKPVNIHGDGLMFLHTVLGFFWMNEKELGFDPTIHKNEGSRYVELLQDGQLEQLHLDEVIQRQRCVAGRATTCWKAFRDGDKSTSPFAVKDSWEYEERPEEGLLLKKLTEASVENVAEYYYHETVLVGGAIDDIRNNVRKGLKDKGGKYRFRQLQKNCDILVRSSKSPAESGPSSSQKRSSNSRQASLPPSKRACLEQRKNRVHRRLVMRRVGKSIYEASSLVAMITGLLGGIKGHESSLERNVLHRDISVGNIMLEQAEDDGFLIDFDLAIEIDREDASGAPSKTGTKVFMAIGALQGEHHSFMHDLESFFWVLFWVCVHWNGPGQGNSRTTFESWNYMSTKQLADIKKGTVVEEGSFTQELIDNFTPYCSPLIGCIQKLRQVIFPGGKRRLDENRELYSRMKSVLEEARITLGAAA